MAESKPKATRKAKPKKDPVEEAKTKPLPPGQYVQNGRIVDAHGNPVGK